MNGIWLDIKGTVPYVTEDRLSEICPRAEEARRMLLSHTGSGSEFLGWLGLPKAAGGERLWEIAEAAQKIREDSDILVVIGIGGSYLGARAATVFLNHSFCNDLPADMRKSPRIYYAGNSISGTYLKELMDVLEGADFSINVISKSGTTLEPAIAFRLLRGLLEKKYGRDGAAGRIYATTDAKKGALKKLADMEGYRTFVVPDDVGGRYSVLTPVGLLPMAVAGIDIKSLLYGAACQMDYMYNVPFDDNEALKYAAVRNILYQEGKIVEVMANYEPGLHWFAEWWKQLFGESEGKGGGGIFPASVDLTTDLHSMGQFLQEGSRIMFESVIALKEGRATLKIPSEKENLDGLNYLSGETLEHVNCKAMEGTVEAHVAGGVPNIIIHMPGQDAASLGMLFYFFEFACAISGYMFGVNPFNQPGVDVYKRNMFRLLGRPAQSSSIT